MAPQTYHPSGLDAPPPGYGPGDSRRTLRRRRPRRLLIAAAALAVAAVFIGLAVDRLLGGTPGKLSLPAASDAPPGPVAAGPVSGTWTVGPGSLAGYRVDEILFGLHHTAVGRTSKVSGGIVISGTTVTAADFTVDMASVESDQAGRNVQFHNYILDTGDYPHATFRLTRALDLKSVPPIGRVVSAQATGILTLRGVSRTVTFTMGAERLADGIDLNGEIPISYGLWHIPNPSFAIASLGRTGTVEVLLHLRAATH